MELVNQRIREANRDLTIILIPLVMLLAKFIQLNILSDKYFFDSWRMLSMLMNSGFMDAWGGYQTTVDFYASINFFEFTTITQWTWFLGLTMTPVVMFIVSRTKEMSLRECIFTLMAVGLLNIYVFNITKEMVQISFFFLIYLIISLPIKLDFLKLLGCAAVFYWESTFYRTYYIIMAVLTVGVYFIFQWVKKQRKMTKAKVVMTIVMCFLSVFLFFYLSSFLAPSDYKEALNIRDNSANAEANSVILNPIPVNNNFGIFMFDYVIDAVRMMIPIELIIKSPAYIPFFIYQIFVLYYYIQMIKNLRGLDNKMLLVVTCFTAYLLGSIVFEPDFGSWVRHESASFPIVQLMVYQSNNYQIAKRGDFYETANV